MTQMSRTEINIRRLLGRCELIAKEEAHNNWRLEKYIFALENMVKELQTMSNKPFKDTMSEYMRRIDFLKGLVDTAKLSNPVERVVATQMLSKSPTTTTDSIGPNITTQIHQKTTAKYNRELRSELFNVDKGSTEDGLRQRLPNSSMQNEDLDAFLKYNRNIQEKVAENMLLMTSNMKEHALTASAIIKKDIGLLEKSNQLTDVNSTKLKTESLKLEEHTKSNWRCWVWLMVAFVLVVFFSRVKVVRALHKYTAQNSDELTFDEGELLYVYGRDADPNWWRARCGNQEGLIPANCVEEQTQEVELPLHEAARRGNLSFLRECLEGGVSGTGLDTAENTALYWAARAGHIDCVKELLKLPNPTINAQNKMGDSPLHAAAAHGHLEVVNLLLKAGTDVTLRNNDDLLAEELAGDISVKNAIQMSQRQQSSIHRYGNDDYEDESD